jgi:hypothetical protein
METVIVGVQNRFFLYLEDVKTAEESDFTSPALIS